MRAALFVRFRAWGLETIFIHPAKFWCGRLDVRIFAGKFTLLSRPKHFLAFVGCCVRRFLRRVELLHYSRSSDDVFWRDRVCGRAAAAAPGSGYGVGASVFQG